MAERDSGVVHARDSELLDDQWAVIAYLVRVPQPGRLITRHKTSVMLNDDAAHGGTSFGRWASARTATGTRAKLAGEPDPRPARTNAIRPSSREEKSHLRERRSPGPRKNGALLRNKRPYVKRVPDVSRSPRRSPRGGMGPARCAEITRHRATVAPPAPAPAVNCPARLNGAPTIASATPAVPLFTAVVVSSAHAHKASLYQRRPLGAMSPYRTGK